MQHPVTQAERAAEVSRRRGPEARRTATAGRPLADWITSPDNPYFARHVANIAWAHFLGRGIVHEPDDARVSNPPANGPLLDELGRRLVASGWDFRGLVRDICTSRTYQRSCEPNASNRLDETNFSHAAVRRPRAEVLLDVLAQVTETKNKFPGLPLGARAVQVADGRTTNYFLTTFGRATREDVCTCAVTMDPSLSQALHLLNGDAANERIRQGNVVGRMLDGGPDARPRSSTSLFVRCDGRMPTERERIETLADGARRQRHASRPWRTSSGPCSTPPSSSSITDSRLPGHPWPWQPPPSGWRRTSGHRVRPCLRGFDALVPNPYSVGPWPQTCNLRMSLHRRLGLAFARLRRGARGRAA